VRGFVGGNVLPLPVALPLGWFFAALCCSSVALFASFFLLSDLLMLLLRFFRRDLTFSGFRLIAFFHFRPRAGLRHWAFWCVLELGGVFASVLVLLVPHVVLVCVVCLISVIHCCSVLQYLYDRVHRGAALRSNLFVALGTFHIFKQASIELLRMTAGYVLAPLFHHLYPTGKFKMFMKLKALTALFGALRLAYPTVKRPLHRAQRAVRPDSRAHTMLTNLLLLLEYYIPLVHLFWSCLSLNFCLSSCSSLSLCRSRTLRSTFGPIQGMLFSIPLSECSTSLFNGILSSMLVLSSFSCVGSSAPVVWPPRSGTCGCVRPQPGMRSPGRLRYLIFPASRLVTPLWEILSI